MKVLHVSPSFFPAISYGGPTYTTHSLCNALATLPDVELRVLTTDTAGPRIQNQIEVSSFPTRMPSGYDVFYCRRLWGRDFAPGLFWRLWGMIRWADVVHLTAVYSAPTLPTLFMCKLLRRPVVWSPRGSLQRWQGSTRPTLKSVWNRISGALCNTGRVVLHFTSDVESEESRSSIPNAQVAVIPNGVDLPGTNGRGGASNETLRLIYLGRLHPIKGIENLLRALRLSESKISLSICGDGEPKYRRSLEALTSELSLDDRVVFHGQVEGEAKQQAFANADVCIVPSFKENFCVVVAEALAHGIPVIASKGTPWSGLEERGCGLWVENSEEKLAEAITKMCKLPRDAMGSRGRQWIASDFSWSHIANQMHQLYEGLCGKQVEQGQT